MIAPWYRELFERPLQLWMSRTMAKPPIRIWERLLAHHTAKWTKYYMANREALPANSSVDVKYEDLCRLPDETMGKIVSFLDVHPQDMDFSKKIAPREPKVLPEALKLFESIRDDIKPYLQLNHYTPEPR